MPKVQNTCNSIFILGLFLGAEPQFGGWGGVVALSKNAFKGWWGGVGLLK